MVSSHRSPKKNPKTTAQKSDLKLNKVVPHESSVGHVTGQAEYIDDRPFTAGEVHVDVFYSLKAHARIKNIDVSKALALPGVIAVYTAKDLIHNEWGSILQDQPFLADQLVQFVGEPIALIAAENKEALIPAKKAIRVEFEELEPIYDIDTAKKKNNLIGLRREIFRSLKGKNTPLKKRTEIIKKIDQVLAKAPHTLSGVIKMAGQDHFYLESQACIAYPKEDNQIEIHSSSQHPTEVQHLVADALGLAFHQVVCIVKRMGGAFGGKESQAAPFAVFAALVALKLKRPARLILTKDDDMIMTGKRNPFQNEYQVAFDNKGKILALKANLYSDGGAYADLSTAIMERAMLHLDNAYFIPHFYVSGQVCKTNTPPNTAFRGFGGPKGVVTIESIIEDIAEYLNLDSFTVREQNIYQKGHTTHYGQTIEDQILPELFKTIKKDSRYIEWRKEVDKHNQSKNNTWRGLSVTAVKFGISFTTRFLNQGNALVNLHLDGSIQVSTGATEMGQGVNTKIAMVVAEAFGVPVNQVRVMATSTEKNPNTSATAASSGSDLNAQAALNAANTIKDSLNKVAQVVLSRPKNMMGRKVAGAGTVPEMDLSKLKVSEDIIFADGFVYHRKKTKNKITFAELLEEAYLNRVALTCQGYFKYPGIFFNKETGQGKPFFYYTNGVAASEVSIDKYTGELKVIRSDILMDLGRPINEGIDHGQVTGGFIQGMGWVTTENLFYRDGLLLSHSPSTYKIPSVHDIPRKFQCRLLNNPTNVKNVRASKATGEPPLLLSISVWAAVKNALQNARKHKVKTLQPPPIVLPLPATQEVIYTVMNHKISGGSCD